MMVEVVEARMASGAMRAAAAASAARFRSGISGTPSNTTGMSASTAASDAGRTVTLPAIAGTFSTRPRPSSASMASVPATSSSAASDKRTNSAAGRGFPSSSVTWWPA